MAIRRLFHALTGLLLGLLPKLTAFAQPGQPADNLYRPSPDIFLLAPFQGDVDTIQNEGTIDIAFEYFGKVWPWVIGSAVGIAVLWALAAGIMIMLSGENSELRSKGIDHLTTVIKGLLIIALAGFILTTLNSVFYE